MPNIRISGEKRKWMIKLWLFGTTRAEIERITGISSGTISNIIADFKKRLDDSDPEALKDLYTVLREHNITPSQCATGFRTAKVINEIGGDDEKMQAFLSKVKEECVDKKVPTSAIVPSLRSTIEFSEKEGIPISEVPDQIEKRRKKLADLRADVEAAKAEKNKVLGDAKLTKEFVNEYTLFKKRLKAVGLTTKDVDAAVNVLLNLRALGHDPKKIVAQYSRIKSFESVEKRHQLKCAQWEERIKSYKQTYRLAEWFVSNGYTRIDLEILQDIIMDIARRERITPAQANGRLFAAIYAFKNRDELERRVRTLAGVTPILEKERDDLINSLPNYRYAVVKIAALAKRVGLTDTKAVVDAMIEILTSPYYSSDPRMLVWDLEKLMRERRKEEQQLPRQQQKKKHDEVSKLKDENDGSSPSVAAVPPALPKRIQKPEGDSSDQCREEEEEGAARGGNTQEVISSNAQEHHDNNQENDGSKSTA
jgi:hypothetical protein